ncbi:MAG: 16S rRNA (guanine(966)-N(2))-methyltransferase RsmD [Candidatus Margulisiibacteriota bacterium]
MRVIAGSAKGRTIKYPKGSVKIRPLSDFAKEGLFNILADKIQNCRFLDLFAGTGQVGIEALSRGAVLAMFVDCDKKAVAAIWDNLSSTGLSDRAEVYVSDVLRAVAAFAKKNAAFDIVFLGAPYTVPVLEPAMEKLAKSDIVKGSGLIIAEHTKKSVLQEAYGSFLKVREVKYGDTVLSFYRRDGSDENSGISGKL